MNSAETILHQLRVYHYFMQPTSNWTSPESTPVNPIARAQAHTIVIIDTDDIRSQRLASLLTLAGLRAIVTKTTYQAFQRFLHERFLPQVILIDQQKEINSTLFARFFQNLRQELKRDVPIIRLDDVHLMDGNLLVADEHVSTSIHHVSSLNSELLKKIWQVLPSARISLEYAKDALVLNMLPQLGLKLRVAHRNRSSALHFWREISAAKKIIPDQNWELLLTDVGLAQFCQEENWPEKNEQQTVPSECLALLTRAVLFSHPIQPAQQVYNWAMQVDAEILQKTAFIFMVQQASKLIGQERIVRLILNEIKKTTDEIRGEELTEYIRLDDGSYIFAIYSNMFIYGFMGATQPGCYMWLAAFNKGLELSKMQDAWKVREIECSSVSHTGHCIFHLTHQVS